MIELLRFEYYRLFKSKVVWLLVAFAALVPILAAAGMQFIMVELGAEGEIDEIIESVSQVRFFTWYCISYFYERLPLVLALFVPLFIGRDYKDGVIRNKLISGHTRMEIFASTIIVQASLAVVLSVIYVLVGIVAMACTSFGVDLNRGEMFGRAFTLLLSLVATTVLFAVISLLIKSRAGTVVICIAFVFSFGMFSLLSTNFAYSSKMVHEYVSIYNEMIEETPVQGGYDSFYYGAQEKVKESDYLNVGWYIGHPIFLTTNASLGDEFVGNLTGGLSLMGDSMFEYPKKISRLGYLNNLTYSLFTGNYGAFTMDFEDIDGAYVSYTEAEIIYNIKSIVWIMIYFGGGYALFRKKNIF